MSKRYDGEPPEDDYEEFEVELYGGPIRYVSIRGGSAPIVTFPNWSHKVILGTNRIVDFVSQDLQEGMAILQDGKVGLIEGVEDGLYCGRMEGTFLGRVPGEDVVERKKAVRDVYTDGRINWRLDSDPPQ